jgi:hypothetical protein
MLSQARTNRQILGMARANSAIRQIKICQFLFSLVEANLPNLIPAKFSGYTVLFLQ